MIKNIEVTKDIEHIGEAGFDKFLRRAILPESTVSAPMPTPRVIPAENIVGGILGSEGTIYVGSENIMIDGANKRIVISDGTNNRILIGYQKDGF